MSSPILHVKDSYYFELPKFLWRSQREDVHEFPDVWLRLDEDFQHWQAEQLCEELAKISHDPPNAQELIAQWRAWQAQGHNAGRPLSTYLEMAHAEQKQQFHRWSLSPDNQHRTFQEFINTTNPAQKWFVWQYEQADWAAKWRKAKNATSNVGFVQEYQRKAEWSKEKIAGYNQALDGKILIPQPFGRLRNLYEPESGVCVSKYMILQVVAALLVVAAFSWLGRRIATGERPRGRMWNLLESFLLFIRDGVARPVMGKKYGDKFAPILWTVFHFILVMNLLGMLPWAGSPTSSFSVTAGMALLILGMGVFFGSQKFGFLGYLLNQAPHMDLPLWIGVVIKPLVLVIEWLGLIIKHCVLAIRLLANMVAGHIVLLGIMGTAVGLEAAGYWTGQPVWQWSMVAVLSLAGTAAFAALELFVAFLQAYIFTFLSALFINAAVHQH